MFKLDNDEVIGSGQCEKIGNPKGIFSIKYTLNGKTEKIEEILPIPNHNVGIKKILDELKKHNLYRFLVYINSHSRMLMTIILFCYKHPRWLNW